MVRTLRLLAVYLVILGCLLSTSWHGIQAKSKIAVADAADRTVMVSSPADRVVLLFNYEEFAAIVGSGAFDRVVGYMKTVWYDWRRSIWNKYVGVTPKIAEIPDVGFTTDGTFSVEKVVALRPDVVIMPRWAFNELGQKVGQLDAVGIPSVVIDYNAMRVETHVASTLAIGKVMGTDPRARQLADLYAARVREVKTRVARGLQGGRRARVYVELGQRGPNEYGNSYGDDLWGPLVETAGGTNIAKGRVVSAAPLSPEYVLAANPEYIFITGSTWTNSPTAVEMGFGVPPDLTNARLRPYLDRPGWRSLSAIRTGQVYALHHGIARTLFDFAGMEFIAKAMFPAQFADVDPEGSMRGFFAKYLPVSFEGTWMLRLRP